MPLPAESYITAPALPRIAFGLEPLYNGLESLLLIAKADELSGMGEWVWRTHQALSTEERWRHKLVMIGLHYAVLPERSWSNLPAYLDYLSSIPAERLRSKMLNSYRQIYLQDFTRGEDSGPPDDDSIMASPEAYLRFLKTSFPAGNIDDDLEREAYTYMADPARMQTLIVEHLGSMWQRYLSAEWEWTLPMVESALDAFRDIDYSHLTLEEAFREVTEHELDSPWQGCLIDPERIVFIPNPHIGPYLGKFELGNALGIVFGARLPKGARIAAPDLSRNEILVRLSALADETRLSILHLVAVQGELRSQDIMDSLSLSQSASSRHLKQLSATGYLTERRCEGAKCYQFNAQRVKDTLEAVQSYLLDH